MSEPQVHVTEEEARAGETPHIVRYVLAISILLVVIGMIVVLGAN